jgi:Ca-activated chloride channel family protein
LAEAQPAQSDPVAGLIDIPLPQEVSLWPQTLTARVAVAVLAAAVIAAVWSFLHRRRVNRYRREALAELDRIEHTLEGNKTTVGLVADLALLVRRTALAAFPREQVAALAGPAWLAFLDRTGDGTEFSRGAGRMLATSPYQRSRPDAGELRSLVDLVRRWIKVHHA